MLSFWYVLQAQELTLLLCGNCISTSVLEKHTSQAEIFHRSALCMSQHNPHTGYLLTASAVIR